MAFDGELLVVLWAEVGPDPTPWEARPGPASEEDPTWLGIERGLPAILTALSRFRDDDGARPKVTWCLRADESVGRPLGRPDALFLRFEKTWDRVRSEGDEIGWNPHLLRYIAGRGWGYEIEDRGWVREMLTETWDEVKRHGVRSVRHGSGYADPEIMSLMEAFGLAVDGTARPGVLRPAGTGPAVNWRGTPARPYHPSPADPRTPGEMRLLETPAAVLLTRHPRTKTRRLAVWNPLRRQPGLETGLHKLTGAGSPAVLSAAFRPVEAYDRLAWRAGFGRGLRMGLDSIWLGFGLRFLERHLRLVDAVRKRYNYRLRFLTAGELADWWIERESLDERSDPGTVAGGSRGARFSFDQPPPRAL